MILMSVDAFFMEIAYNNALMLQLYQMPFGTLHDANGLFRLTRRK